MTLKPTVPEVMVKTSSATMIRKCLGGDMLYILANLLRG
jgi:hypothetical protein